jgi:predicted amidophosphoribosyltransferase
MPSRVMAELLAIVVPPACVVCRAALPRADLRLCSSCTRALPWLPARLCRRCGMPSHRRDGCPAASAAFTRAWAPLAHDGVARELVAALKFRAALPVASLMAAHVAANLPADIRESPTSESLPPLQYVRNTSVSPPQGDSLQHLRGGQAPAPPPAGSLSHLRDTAPSSPPYLRSHRPAAVVPVPPQPARGRRRGFDPAGALAAALALRLGLPDRTCLRRCDRERRQVGASRAERRRSGRLTIELLAPPPDRALLVDDVHTTGATLDACAKALLVGGCREVVALTYTRTL